MMDKKGESPSEGDVEAKTPETVSLEVFITHNWQILTIFGVFAGFTNYMSALENNLLVTVGFLLTFIVELEILMLLLRTKNSSFLLKAFTLLSIAFILIFAGLIYSNHVSGILSNFGVLILPIIEEHRVSILRAVFFISITIILLGLYRHIRSFVAEALRFFGAKDKILMAGVISTILIIIAAALFLTWLSVAPAGTGLAENEIIIKPKDCTGSLVLIANICCLDSDGNGVCDDDEQTTSSTTSSSPTTSYPTTSTTTTVEAPLFICQTNRDCGNQTETLICNRGDVYKQISTPLCQKPGTVDARCVFKTKLDGEGITQTANPFKRCEKGCDAGNCL